MSFLLAVGVIIGTTPPPGQLTGIDDPPLSLKSSISMVLPPVAS